MGMGISWQFTSTAREGFGATPRDVCLSVALRVERPDVELLAQAREPSSAPIEGIERGLSYPSLQHPAG